MPRFVGPYNEPGRKTDYYMPPENRALDDRDYSFLEHVREIREDRPTPATRDAFRESLEHALRGERHPTDVSCLRGRLHRAVVELANDVRAAYAQADEPSRLKMRIAAIEKTLAALKGYNVVRETRDGRAVWRLRLPR